jgi:hypothetical protein
MKWRSALHCILGGGGQTAAQFGTLLVDLDPANAVESSGVVAVGAGLGTCAFAQLTEARRPTLNAADSNFNGKPSISFAGGSTQWLVSDSNPDFSGADTVTVVVVCRIESTGTGVIFETSADPNANPGCVTLYNDNTTAHLFYSGATGTPDSTRDLGAISERRYLGCEYDLGQADAAGISLYQDGSEVALGGGGSATATTVATQPWYVGARGGSSFPFTGRIARLLGYSGTVDQAALYAYLAGLYGA